MAKRKYLYYKIVSDEGSDWYDNYRQALGSFLRRTGSITMYGFHIEDDREYVIRSKK